MNGTTPDNAATPPNVVGEGIQANARPRPPILKVEGLSTALRTSRGLLPVVHDVSFTVEPNQTVAVVGESGSGKSVTALSLMRLFAPQLAKISGRAELEGRDLLSLTETEMRTIRGSRIGMVFQEPMTSLNPVMTIGQQIGETLRRHNGMAASAARSEARALLDKVRIPSADSRLDDYPHNLSGGMRQRVMIAMALACKPSLLIADEPTTALDVSIQAQILDLLKSLQESDGLAVLFITHDMGVVAEIADRTVVMRHGRVVEDDRTENIFKAAQHPYTQSLMAAVPRLGAMRGKAMPAPFLELNAETGLPKAGIDDARPSLPPDTDIVLKVENLSTRFPLRSSGVLGRIKGRIHAVENVSFDLAKGETIGVVGESGCGKSTTGRSIMRLVEPDTGSILVGGVDFRKLKGNRLRQERGAIQMIFQDPMASLNPRVPVGQIVAAPLLAHGHSDSYLVRQKVEQALADVGLTAEMADRYPHQFSGGQRQRICIARALVVDPKVIVADEAVSALDVSIKAQVVNLLLALQQRRRLSYVFISHDMAIIERVSHRVAVMYLGEIVEIGPRHAVLDNPQHPYTRRLMSAVPIPDPAQRGQRHHVVADDLKSPIRPPDYVAPVRRYIEIAPGHLVQETTDEWR
ncbi:ABC transporter ATP-binding protein [Devosia sp. 2618]|uniref:ABC transporter ATP-binding protein n=1 Tax=Devosia sp. 2618 TaxID=3156454 RepID=UPI0033927727